VFDVAGLFPAPEFSTIEDDAFAIWSKSQSNDPYNKDLSQQLQTQFNIPVSGQHYFINSNGLAPVWDFRADGPTKGNKDAIVVAKVDATIPSPTGPPNVDWVQLSSVSGKLATKVFRVNTVEGDPPPSVSISRSAMVVRD